MEDESDLDERRLVFRPAFLGVPGEAFSWRASSSASSSMRRERSFSSSSKALCRSSSASVVVARVAIVVVVVDLDEAAALEHGDGNTGRSKFKEFVVVISVAGGDKAVDDRCDFPSNSIHMLSAITLVLNSNSKLFVNFKE